MYVFLWHEKTFPLVAQYNNASTLLLGLLPVQAESEIVIKLEAMAEKVIPFYEHGWYIILSKLMFCVLIYIITMLAIIRPLLRVADSTFKCITAKPLVRQCISPSIRMGF